MVLTSNVIKNLNTGFQYIKNGLTEKGRLYVVFASEEWANGYENIINPLKDQVCFSLSIAPEKEIL